LCSERLFITEHHEHVTALISITDMMTVRATR